jgi:uncharacterized peroxidase-related enzyme
MTKTSHWAFAALVERRVVAQSPHGNRLSETNCVKNELKEPIVTLKTGDGTVSEATQRYFDICMEKLGLVPNVLQAYAFDDAKLRAFTDMYNDLMLGDSTITKLEREMIAVVVSSVNRCFYCLTAHGAAVRELSGDPVLGELMVMNYRAANLDAKTRAMLDFAVLLTESPEAVEDEDRDALREAGFDDRTIWDIASVAAFFNMTNRVAAASDMRPNAEYHGMAR